jgi:coenzyme F420-reducing hydrogenase delta subunit
VLVLTCHEDNCHSSQGNRFARLRVEHAAEFLANCGADPKRLRVETLAANMAHEFSHIVTDFRRDFVETSPWMKKGT